MADDKKPQYVKTVDANGVVRYKFNGQLVKAAEVPEEIKTALENVEPGVGVDPIEGDSSDSSSDDSSSDEDLSEDDIDSDDAGDEEDDSDDTDEAASQPSSNKPATPQVTPTPPIDSPDDVDDESGVDQEEVARARRIVKKADADNEVGMGFPRKNGKTVDIFDGKTPHTHIRLVGNKTVPLTKENHDTKSDSEIRDQLKKLKIAVD